MSALRRHAPTSGPRESDALILTRVAQGDLSALGVLYDRHAAAVLRFARRIAGDDAEDIVQAVFLRATRLAATFDPNAPSARPWLFAITARMAQEYRRALRRRTAALLRFASLPPKPLPAISEMRPDLDRHLLRLSVAKRTVLVLSEVDGFACEEIASMLGIPVGTVWTRLHHARRELRRHRERGES